MFNSLHLVHIIALLQEESLPIGDKMQTKSLFCCSNNLSFNITTPQQFNPSLLLQILKKEKKERYTEIYTHGGKFMNNKLKTNNPMEKQAASD